MALYRVDFQGTLQGIEEFQHGHHVLSDGPSADVAADADAAWTTFLGTAAVNTFWNTGCVWAQVNVSELGATPSAPVVTSAQSIIGVAGTSGDSSLPPQVSVCVSFNTATAGSRARGRMFLPAPDTTALVATGRLSSAFRTAVGPALQTYFNTMEAGGHQVMVVSSVGAVYTPYAVNNIRLGDVLDTQRRRRNSIAEVYSVFPI